MFEQNVGENVFLRDEQALRQHSRDLLSHETGRRDNALAVDLLQSVLAAEIICVMRYTLLAISEEGLKNQRIATEFQAQANDERRHMTLLAQRIEALGGTPEFSPAGLNSRISALSRGDASLAVRLWQNLAAEQCVVDHYRELIAFFEPHDPETAEILKEILQDEEDHTGDMQDLLVSYAG
jgi:bacterioferritin